ncbi:MAG: glycerophosphodiester phosphodiesterase [Acidimicrobiia bacterium]
MLVLAHRGMATTQRENTLPAFAAAREVGADGVELDVRRTADGALVVHHDPTLDDGALLAALSASQLPAWLPTLEAALEECRGLVVDAEVKNLVTEPGFDPEEATARQTAALVARMGMAGSAFVSSFSMTAIDAAREAEPSVRTAWLTLAAYDQADALALAAARGHAALQPRHEAVTTELVAATHGRGLALHAWTVDDPARIRHLADCGADAVITNRPDVALDALGRRR